jgi:hypothetical protein
LLWSPLPPKCWDGKHQPPHLTGLLAICPWRIYLTVKRARHKKEKNKEFKFIEQKQNKKLIHESGNTLHWKRFKGPGYSCRALKSLDWQLLLGPYLHWVWYDGTPVPMDCLAAYDWLKLHSILVIRNATK